MKRMRTIQEEEQLDLLLRLLSTAHDQGTMKRTIDLDVSNRQRDEKGRFLPAEQQSEQVVEESSSLSNDKVITWEPVKGKDHVYIRCTKLEESDKEIWFVVGVLFVAALIF